METSKIAADIEYIISAYNHDCDLSDDIVTQSSVFSELGMDLEDIHCITMRCEDVFNISIPDDAITEQSRVSELTALVAYLRGKLDD